MPENPKTLLFRVSGPETDKIYDAIANMQKALKEVREQYDILSEAIHNFELTISQRDAE